MNLVFDFGAVLFTWQPAQLLLQTFPERLSTPAQAAQLAHQVFGHADWHDFDRGVLSMATVIQQTAQRLDLPQETLAGLVASIGERLTPMSATVALLEQLHQRRLTGAGITGLYYLSNMPVPYARYLQAHHAFLRWFDGGIFSGDVHQIKPEPVLYQLLQDRYALDPARTLFIDDLPANVQAAIKLGWQGIHFESAPQLAQALSGL